jgi:putative aldouronate transport system permease protein
MISLTNNRKGPLSPVVTGTAPKKTPRLESLFIYIRENWTLALLALPAVTLIFLFSYLPNFGTVIAFEDYSPKTLFFSKWVWFENFRLLWQSPIVFRLVRNTLLLNIMFITATTFMSVLVALLLNEVRSRPFKSIAQSLMFLPYFMGWTLVAMVMFGLIDFDSGTINALLVKLGFQRINLTENANYWPWILTVIRIWKGTGNGCIIYLAALVSVAPELYEAAAIDGAGRLARMRYISIPALVPLVILLTLLAIGGIFYGDVGMIYTIVGKKPMLYPTTDVIDTYILRALRENSNYGMIAAVGLSQSVLGFICVYGSNQLAKRYSRSRGEDYSLF